MISKRPGRPKNPYAAAPWGLVPESVHEWLLHYNRGRHRREPPPPASIPALTDAIERILEADLPRPRRYLHDLLVFRYGFDPLDVTKAIERARQSNVVVTPVRVAGDPKDTHIYSYRRSPTKTELNVLTRMLHEVRVHMSPQRLGDVAESYVYGILRRSGAYTLPQRRKIGELRDGAGKNKIDILAVRKWDGKKIAISIKNERSFLTPGHTAFPELIEMAKAHNAWGWLIAAHMTHEATIHAATHGIRCTRLGRQILPLMTTGRKNMRVAVEGLRHVIGPAPFEYVPMNRLPPSAEWAHDPWSGIGLDSWVIPDETPEVFASLPSDAQGAAETLLRNAAENAAKYRTHDNT